MVSYLIVISTLWYCQNFCCNSFQLGPNSQNATFWWHVHSATLRYQPTPFEKYWICLSLLITLKIAQCNSLKTHINVMTDNPCHQKDCMVTQTTAKKINQNSLLFRKRNDVSIKDVEKKRGASQEILTKLQQQYQQLLTKAAAKA